MWGLREAAISGLLGSLLPDLSDYFKVVPLALLCLLMLGAHRDSLVAGPPSPQLLAPQQIGVLAESSDVSGDDGRPSDLAAEPAPLEGVTALPHLTEQAEVAVEPASTVVEEAFANTQPPPTAVHAAPQPTAPGTTPIPAVAFPAAPAAPAPAVAAAAPAAVVLPAPTATPALTPTSTPTPTVVAPGGTAVDILLSTGASVVTVGDTVTALVTVNAGPNSPVDAAQVYLDFDASLLQVTAVTEGSALSVQLQSSHDNAKGEINYAAGTLDSAILSPFTLLTVKFQTLAATGPTGTTIRFAPLSNPRHTKVVSSGEDVTGVLGDTTVVIE